MASRSKSDDPSTEDLNDLNERIAKEAAAATTAEARADGGGLRGVTTSDVS